MTSLSLSYTDTKSKIITQPTLSSVHGVQMPVSGFCVISSCKPHGDSTGRLLWLPDEETESPRGMVSFLKSLSWWQVELETGAVHPQSQCSSGKLAPVGCAGATQAGGREVSCWPVGRGDPVSPRQSRCPCCFREGPATLLCYPCLPRGLASLFLVSKQAKQEGKKINQQHMISSRKSSAASRARGRSLLRRLKCPRSCPSCRRVLGGPETPGLTGRCPRPQPTRRSVLASRLPLLLPIRPREICWCPVLPGASSGFRQSRFPSAV